MNDASNDDVLAIEAVIERQFPSLSWSWKCEAEWQAFATGIIGTASLNASARPPGALKVGNCLQRKLGARPARRSRYPRRQCAVVAPDANPQGDLT